MTNVIPDPDEATIIGQFPISNLLALDNVGILESARPLYPVSTNIGLVNSQGDSAMRSDVARDIFKVSGDRSIDGRGVKIGVISNSYNSKNEAYDDMLKFDLPGHSTHPLNNNSVQLIKEFPYGEASDEGRAMMHIIHDIAPGAELAFRTGVLGAIDMADGIRELDSAGCDIIVDDITYITEPFFTDGIIAQTVDDVVNNGDISYFTSAGNFGDQSYQSTFNYASEALVGISGTPHEFAPGDIYQEITLAPGKYVFVLQWHDNTGFYETNTDLDVFLSNGAGKGFIGYNKNNIGQEAIEILPFAVNDTTTTNLVIVNTTNNDPIEFKYIIFRGPEIISAEYFSGSSTIFGHANAEAAMTVGAIRYDYTPAFENSLTIMSFSSTGGLFVDGAERYKPDFTAPNGVNTGVLMGGPEVDIEGDSISNFFGTSAAAPHAAAVAALLKDARNAYFYESLDPVSVKTILTTTALSEDGNNSFDHVYGHGFLQADAAIMNFANPRPVITGLSIYPEDSVPGINEIILTISGEYFIDDATEIYFNGILMTSSVTTGNTREIVIPSYTDLYPALWARNPAISPSGNDGGDSDPVYLTVKPTIVGIIGNPVKSYGENIPENGYSATYFLNDIEGNQVPLADAGLTPEQYERIVGTPQPDFTPGIPIVTNATALSNVGQWPIYASENDPLNPEYSGSMTGLSDVETELLNNYNFRFENGLLTITKLDLTITPNDQTIDYGDPVSNITYDYSYDKSNITYANQQIIDAEINTAYTGDMVSNIIAMADPATIGDGYGDITNVSFFVSQNALAALNGQALALVNGQALALVNGQALALVNGQALALVNGQALALVNGQALALVNANSLVNGQALALVNHTDAQPNGQALALVNGQALALVNNPDPDWLDPNFVTVANGQALALVNQGALSNGQALALVNGQALALVNSTTVNDVNNNEAIIILTKDDIVTATTQNASGNIELASMNFITGNTAGTHSIAPGAFIAANFNVSYDLGTLTVNKREVIVSGDHQVIFEGEPEPPFSFSYNGFVNGDNETIIFGASGPAYYTGYIDQPGIYHVNFPAETDNYFFTVQPEINLYVNPDDNGTKSVKPKLRCVDEADPATGYAYIAYFEYDNDNTDPVFVFTGPDNLLTIESNGSWAPLTPQPQLFEAGGSNGTAWEVLFDGNKITWTVKSLKQGDPSGVGSSASSTSSRCNKSAEFEPGNDPGTAEYETGSVYPNPSSGMIHIQLQHAVNNEQDVSIYDIFGREIAVSVIKDSGKKISLNIASLKEGMYFIRANTLHGQEVLKFIKQDR
jgi:hypothetical protein